MAYFFLSRVHLALKRQKIKMIITNLKRFVKACVAASEETIPVENAILTQNRGE